MSFFQWSTKDPLEINDYGIPEPISNVVKSPNILLVPLVAFDNKRNRIGYGGGYYDKTYDVENPIIYKVFIEAMSFINENAKKINGSEKTTL